MGFRDLKLRLRALITPGRVERDLHDELAFHVERETRKLIDQGLPPHEARARALARFGSIAVVADECRDERGTAFVHNTLRDIRFALRSFRHAPLAAVTIVGTVAIGLGVVAVLFTILNAWLFRVDAVPAVSEMYSVQKQLESGQEWQFTRPQFEALRKETRVFTDAYAAVPNIDVRVNGRTMAGTLVTGNFFEVVGVAPVMGRALTPADDHAGNPVIVLSDKGWRRHFDRDPQVLGRTLRMGTAQFDIVGVMPTGFRGLEFNAPDFWAPLPRLSDFLPASRGREGTVGVEVIGRLRPDLSLASARARIAAWESNLRGGGERPNGTIVLERERGTFPQPPAAVAVFTPLFFVFGLVLLIGCANVANLLLARGVARQRELGIRLSLGASRWRIVRQLMTESCLLALAAAGAAYVISRIALEGMFRWFSQAMPVDLGDPNVDLSVPAADWRVALFLILAAMVATALFALLPALQATRIEPLRTLRGELVRDARPRRSRNALIGIQVFASALLLVCAAIFLRSAIASSRFDAGFRTADTVLIDIPSEPRRAAMLQAIASEPTITAHAAMRPSMMAPPLRAFALVGDRRIPVPYKFVSPEYFDVFGISILRGRAFTTAERDAEALVAIVSESTARALWPDGGGLGESLRLEEDPGSGSPPKDASPAPSRLVTVVGVSREVPGFRISDSADVRLFLPTSVNTAQTSVAARVAGDPDLVRQTLLDRLTQVDPNMGMVVTMRTLARLETFFLRIAFSVSLALGGLALVLTVSGLFSVLSYLVEQRRREIGVRMALGASSRNVAGLILAQTTRPVLYGLLAGAGLAASLATALLSIPVGASIAQVIRVNDPIAYAGSVLAIVLACLLAAWLPATRAARLDPMQAIRQD